MGEAMRDFEATDLVEAYKMLSGHETAILATKGGGVYNLTPYGWFMPMDYEPVTKLIVSSDPAHQADVNIRRTQKNLHSVCRIENKAAPTGLNHAAAFLHRLRINSKCFI